MDSPIDDKLKILSLSTEDFTEGLASMMRAFIDQKDKKETKLFKPSSGSYADNVLLLEDNTPINLGP